MVVQRATRRLQRRLRDVITAQPPRGAYVSALGGDVPWLDDVMSHPDAKDAYGHGASLAAVAKWLNVPTSLITGWHDALGGQTFERADPSGLRPTRVCVHVGGEDDWRDIDDWPPATAVSPWFPTVQGHIAQQAPKESAPLALLARPVEGQGPCARHAAEAEVRYAGRADEVTNPS